MSKKVADGDHFIELMQLVLDYINGEAKTNLRKEH